MATLTISDIEDDTAERLRIRAASHGHSVEEEARLILQRAVKGISGPAYWVSRELFGTDGVSELPLPSRGEDRAAPDFAADDEL